MYQRAGISSGGGINITKGTIASIYLPVNTDYTINTGVANIKRFFLKAVSGGLGLLMFVDLEDGTYSTRFLSNKGSMSGFNAANYAGSNEIGSRVSYNLGIGSISNNGDVVLLSATGATASNYSTWTDIIWYAES